MKITTHRQKILFLIILLIGIGGIFFIVRPKETSVLPQTLIIEQAARIEAPVRRDVLIQKSETRYCMPSTQQCGHIQFQTPDRFTIQWETGSIETFQKNQNDIYILDNGTSRSHALLPPRPTIQIQLNAEIKELRQDENGLCFDSDDTYLGTILSESYTQNTRDSSRKKAIFFEMITGNRQMFIQNHNGVYQSQKMPDKKFKLLVFTYSYKRPLFLSGQILRFFNQTNQNFDMRVSVKGVSAEDAAQTFIREWAPFIQKGRLRVTFDKNKDQMSNLMDALEGVDLNRYDYFCKVDDDDWYAPTYLETLTRHLNTDSDILTSVSMSHYRLLNAPENAYLTYTAATTVGATLCFNREIAQALFTFQKMTPAEQQKELGVHLEQLQTYQSTGEDVLIHQLAQKRGKTQIRNTPVPLFIYGAQYPSITRPENK